jgi:hypothetical protein
MPFICLANANVPEGVLQITDLWPNVSQDNNPTNPAGQTRYLRRPGTDNPAVNLTTGVVEGSAAQSNLANFDGLGAYLVDKVEPGSLEQATADITLAVLPLALDRIIIGGVVFIEFSAGASDPTATGLTGDPFVINIKATPALTATEFSTVMTNAAAIATMKGLLGATNYVDSNDALGVITLDALTGAAANLLGGVGDFALALAGVGAATRITLPEPARLARAAEAWDAATVTAAVAAVLARMDAGTADMNLAGINVALLAGASAELTGAAATSASVGTVAELLQVLAGRTYRVPAGGLKFTAVTAPDTAHAWSATLRGSFTTPNPTWDTDMLSGEWGATTAGAKYLKTGGNDDSPTFAGGGDVVNNDVGGARQTFDSTAFQASVLSGQLFRYANGISLFPDPDVQAFVDRRHPNGPAALARVAPLVNQRIVTVFDDDGTLLV